MDPLIVTPRLAPDRLDAIVDPANTASIRLPKLLDMQRLESVRRPGGGADIDR